MHVLRDLGRASELCLPKLRSRGCTATVSAQRRLIRFPLMLDPIRKKTLVTDLAHVDQQAARAGGQKRLGETGQRWRFGSAEHVRREREIELIDEAAF